MAGFDFINSATKGYEFVWTERRYLLRVAIPVFFVKLACLFAIFVLGAQNQYLRQGLISLPGTIVEAIFIIGLIRYFIYREPIFIWGKLTKPPKSNIKYVPYEGYLSKKQCIQGGIALFLLIKIAEASLLGLTMDNIPAMSAVDIPEEELIKLTPAMSSLIMFISLVLFTWLFKFVWIFIPTALGYPLSYYLKKMPGLRGSVGMVAAWLVCSIPLLTLFSAILQLVAGGFIEGSSGSIVLTYIIKAIAEIIITSVQVVAMTYGINKILSGHVDD